MFIDGGDNLDHVFSNLDLALSEESHAISEALNQPQEAFPPSLSALPF